MAARHAAAVRPRRGYREWLRGVGALLVLAVLVVGIPVLLIAVAGIPFVHGLPSWSHLASRLRQPDDGQLLLDVLLVLAWTGWAAFTVSVAAETVAIVRHSVAPTLLGLASLQSAAGRLIAAVALLLPASGAALHLGVGAAQPRPALTAPMRPADVTTASPAPAALTAVRGVANRAGTPVVLSSAVLPVYVVGTDPTGQRDTLWSIAARHLRSPLRWQEIAQLNVGQRQDDGAVFTDPNLIRPGWKLQLPADATGLTRPDKPAPSQPPTQAHPTHPHANPRIEPPLTPVPAPVVAPPDATPTPTSAPTQVPPPVTTAPVPPDADPSWAPATPASARSTGAAIPLGAGSEISGALAAALLLALSLRRLRRRQHYQPRPPHPAQLTHRPPLPPPLRQLLTHTPGPRDVTGFMSGPLSNASPPGSWQLGTRDEHPVALSWQEYPVLSFSGAGAAAVLRAFVVTALLDSCTGTDILAVGGILDVLFHAQPVPAGVHRLETPHAVGRVQPEVLSRSRLLADADLPDAAAYRTHNPEDPLPALLVLVDHTLEVQPALYELLHANPHLDIVAVVLGDERQPHQLPNITVDAAGDVLATQPATLNLAGVRLYRLTDADAATLLGVTAPVDTRDTIPQARADAATDIDWPATAAPPAVAPPPAAPSAVAPPPAASPAAEAPASVVPPTAGRSTIRVQVLGPVRIWVHDVEITTGLRRAGRELLAWYLLHPEGRPIEAAVDALWPNEDPDHGGQRFWNALNSLRARLRSAADEPKLQVLKKSGDNYLPPPPEFDVDLWTFQAALQAAARSSETVDKLGALHRAIDAYTGLFAAETDYLWAEPIRQECHRRALDAHVAYATLTGTDGHVDQAISTLESALTLDPYAEDIYRRLMRLHHSIGHKDSVRRLWQQLDNRLLDIDSEPEPETYRTYRQCL